MTNTTDPFIHDGENSWNALVRKVNAILESPPSNTDCDPIAPVPEVDECHRWKAQEITDVQKKLIETCETLSFTDVESCDTWQLSLIEELENALSETWCDCNPDNQCQQQCSNAQADTTTFLQSHTVTDSDCVDITRPCDFPPCGDTNIEIADNTSTYNATLLEAATLGDELCVLINEVEDLEEEVAALQVIKDNQCAGDPSSEDCSTATANLEAKQEVLTEKIAERDAKQIEYDAKLVELEVLASNSLNLADKLRCFTEDIPSINLLNQSHIAADTGCDVEKSLCESNGLIKCSVSWVIERRLFYTEIPDNFCSSCIPLFGGVPFAWVGVLFGTWSPSGEGVVRSARGCGGALGAFKVASNDCDSPALCVRGCITTHEYRLKVNFPIEFEPFCCNTGAPCTPGEDGQCQEPPVE